MSRRNGKGSRMLRYLRKKWKDFIENETEIVGLRSELAAGSAEI